MAVGSVAGLTVMTAGSTTRASVRLPLNGPLPPELSVAVTVKLKVPPAVGVPLMVPPVARESPAGSAPPVTV